MHAIICHLMARIIALIAKLKKLKMVYLLNRTPISDPFTLLSSPRRGLQK
jgi:hypothetical protein